MLLFGFAVEVVEELPVLSVRVNVVLGKEGGHGFVVSKETE